MMSIKKITCLLLVLIFLVSAVSCAGGNEGNDDVSTDATASQSETADEGADTYDGVFQVGYGIADITPDVPIPLNTGVIMTDVIDPLYVTCIAVNDGKNTALIITADVKNMGEGVYKAIRKRISVMTKVPEKNIIMSATHNHSAPTPNNTSGDQIVVNWTAKVTNYFVDAAKDAIADLSDSEIYVGTGKTTNMAFVRCYVHEDGGVTGINTRLKNSTPIVGHVTEADDTVQIIRFKRDDKKDVVMANWQAHVAHAIAHHPHSITADLVHMLRREFEKEDDILFAYYQGASGNINLNTYVASLKKYNNSYQLVGRALAKVILGAMDDLKRVQPGEIKTLQRTISVDRRVETDTERIAQAKEVVAAGPEDSEAYNAVLDKYKFHSKYDVNSVIARSKMASKSNMLISTIGFGDLGFVTAPYEMYDTNGMEVKEGSPYEMTFVLTCAGGSGGYIPAANAVQYGNYEVYVSSYKYGTAEEVVEELLDMLNRIKNK